MTAHRRILLLSGSIRKHSCNTGLLRALEAIGHPSLTFQWADLSEFPIFNEDVEATKVPDCVQKVKDQTAKANGLIFAATEHNYSASACLKNAYDWISRNGLIKKYPVGLVSTGGMEGGLNGQKSIRQMGKYFELQFMQKPVIAVNRFSGKHFDEKGNLINPEIKEQLKVYLEEYAKWVAESHI